MFLLFACAAAARRLGGGDVGFVETDKVFASDAEAGDLFGASLAVSENTVLVGASTKNSPRNQSTGAAYVFSNEQHGLTHIQKLQASDATTWDSFGHAVALDGDVAVVSSFRDDLLTGSAYVFHRGDNGFFTQVHKLVASDGQEWDQFGCSVAIDGDLIVIGSRGTDDAGLESGSAYVYDSQNFVLVEKLIPSDGAAANRFGYAVAVSEQTVVVGAPDAVGGGAAYVFCKGPNTVNQTQKLMSYGAYGDHFGNAIAMSGNILVVAAVGEDNSAGSVYIFVKTAGFYTQTQKFSGGNNKDAFGVAVAISCGVIVVGSDGSDDDGEQSGSVFVYRMMHDLTFTQDQKLTASDAALWDHFGAAVGISDNLVVVGAFGDDDNGLQSGSVYAFTNGTILPSGGSKKKNSSNKNATIIVVVVVACILAAFLAYFLWYLSTKKDEHKLVEVEKNDDDKISLAAA